MQENPDTPTDFKEIALEGVRGVLTDLDDTLYAYRPAHSAALMRCFEEWKAVIEPGADVDVFKKEYRRCRTVVTERLAPQGSCRSRYAAFLMMLEARKRPAAYAEALRFEDLYWEHFMSVIQPDAGALAFLERCKEAGVPVCIVTNMQYRFQVRKLEALGLTKLAEFMVASEHAGAEKPHTKAFDAGLELLGMKANEVIMLGDSYEADILGAQQVGIRAYQIDLYK